ncbi:MAG TPA: hypothetical protein DCE43_10070 [Planctomycetaceae bacterium]|nr:hypothetical protein [Planctomycetaceae bacterium]HCK54274.1 hypothetical protein [Planctomycetaceae bacterium]|tara:strand:- start:256 stop:1206 length:951 start_codon:yes stop_codon:yes gene_type:complete
MASRLRTPRLIVGLTLSLAILLVAPTTHAQVVLRPKLKPNSKRVFHSEASTKQILTLAGMDVETSSNQFVVMEQVTQPRSDDGTLRLTDTNKKLQQEITLPGFKISFDSDNPNKKAPLPQLEPMLDLLRLIAKSRVTLVLDKSDRVVKVEGVDELLRDLDPAVRKSFSSQFSAPVILENWKSRRQRIPGEAVKVGEEWKYTTVMNLEAGQKISVTRQYTYAGTTKKGPNTLHRITTKSLGAKLTQDPPEGSPTKITKSQIKVEKGTGEILVDLERGLVVSDSDSTRMTGPLTLEVNGMSLDATLDLTITTKLQFQR